MREKHRRLPADGNKEIRKAERLREILFGISKKKKKIGGLRDLNRLLVKA